MKGVFHPNGGSLFRFGSGRRGDGSTGRLFGGAETVRALTRRGGSLDKVTTFSFDQLLSRFRLAARWFRPASLGLFLIFAGTAYWGVQIVRFERLNNQVGRALDTSPGAADSLLQSVAAWKDTPGVASRARGTVLEIVVNHATSVAAVAHALFDVVEASPTSSGAWQALAEIESVRGDYIDHMLDAFRMSALTGSHEGALMKQRAIFGLQHWTELPERDRDTLVRDLLATAREPQVGTQAYRTILAEKSEAEREEIRKALTVSGLAPKELLQALGV